MLCYQEREEGLQEGEEEEQMQKTALFQRLLEISTGMQASPSVQTGFP